MAGGGDPSNHREPLGGESVGREGPRPSAECRVRGTSLDGPIQHRQLFPLRSPCRQNVGLRFLLSLFCFVGWTASTCHGDYVEVSVSALVVFLLLYSTERNPFMVIAASCRCKPAPNFLLGHFPLSHSPPSATTRRPFVLSIHTSVGAVVGRSSSKTN